MEVNTPRIILEAAMSECEILKQPWLTKEEIFNGKTRHFHLELFNLENSSRQIEVDRSQKTKSSFVDDEETNFNWDGFKSDTFESNENEVLLDILGDINSHSLVVLGKDRLDEETARKHIKIYQDYMQRKEQRLMRSVEKELKRVKKSTAAKSRRRVDFNTKAKTNSIEKSTNPKDKENSESELIMNTKEAKRGKDEFKMGKVLTEDNSIESKNENLTSKHSQEGRKCEICQEICQDLDEHLAFTHYKARILDEYPNKNFKCFFTDCSFFSVPNSHNYLKHIGIEHNIIKTFEDASEAQTSSEQIIEDVNIKFRCPLCHMNDISNPRNHLSRHFSDRVRAEFPFIKEGDGFMCPIAECSSKPMSSSKLVHHINLDHDQMNIYLQEKKIQMVMGSKKRKKNPSDMEISDSKAKRRK